MENEEKDGVIYMQTLRRTCFSFVMAEKNHANSSQYKYISFSVQFLYFFFMPRNNS